MRNPQINEQTRNFIFNFNHLFLVFYLCRPERLQRHHENQLILKAFNRLQPPSSDLLSQKTEQVSSYMMENFLATVNAERLNLEKFMSRDKAQDILDE